LLHQAHYGGKHFVQWEAGQSKIFFYSCADSRQRFSEFTEPVKLRLVTHFAPQRMIFILLASLCIKAGRLQMSIVLRADPYILPCRRKYKATNALQHFFVRHFFVFTFINKTFSALDPPDAGLGILNVHKIYFTYVLCRIA
jgi:hypothetical protein